VQWSAVVISGLVGTAVLTVLMAMAPAMGMPRMDMMRMLGSMFLPEGAAAVMLGGFMHFVIGVVFAAVYVLLWRSGVGAPTLGWGFVFGVVHGLLAVTMMPVLRAMHPRRPELPAGPAAAVGVVAGHALYGLVVAGVYRWVLRL
jgi:uncharacterized membrane protein YagU involved in acid resistance